MTCKTVTYRREGRIAYVTLNRSRVLNAVNKALEQDLAECLHTFDLDDEAWVAVLHGAGRAFCSGADVKERFHAPDSRQRDADWGMGMNPEGFLGRCINWKPVIAAVHGYCLGYGLVIAVGVRPHRCRRRLRLRSDRNPTRLSRRPGVGQGAELHAFQDVYGNAADGPVPDR